MTEPIAPQGVLLLTTDELTIPVECVYAGVDEQDYHVWDLVEPEGGWPAIQSVYVDVWPPRTAIAFGSPR